MQTHLESAGKTVADMHADILRREQRGDDLTILE